jgi:membrane fusion protein, multidrug efflux system
VSAVALDRQKAVGKNEVEIAKVREQRAKAELDALKPRLDECQFFAPFDGRIVDLILRVHERTEPNRPYLTIIDDGKLEIEVIVPSRTLSVLQIGNTFTFQIDELEKAIVTAKVKSIAAAVEPVSKTVKLVGVIEQPLPGILAGMSGTVSFASGIGQ